MGFFDGLTQTMQNPLFLGGVSLMSGGGPDGMMQGMKIGNAMMQQRKAQEAIGPALAGLKLGDAERSFFEANPEAASDMLARLYAERFDPMSEVRRKTAEANLTQAQNQNSLFPLQQQELRAKIAQAGRGGESPSNVREWEYYTKLAPEQRAEYLNMKRSVPYLDTGTQFVQPNPVGPEQPPRTINKNVAETEAQKIVGRETGEGRMALPKTERALQMYEKKSAIIDQDIDKAINLVGPSTTGFVGAGARFIPGAPAYDLDKTLQTIKANIGFDELQDMRANSPTGGALGQVAVQEINFLQSVLGSLEQGQGDGQLISNLRRIKAARKEFAAMRRQAYEQDVKRFGAANVPNPDPGSGAPAQGGVRRYNPATGNLE